MDDYYAKTFLKFPFNTTSIENFLNRTTYAFGEVIALYGFNGSGLKNNIKTRSTYLTIRGLCHTIIPQETVTSFVVGTGYYLYLSHNARDKTKDNDGLSTSGFEIYIHNENDVITDQDNVHSEFLYLETAEDMHVTLSVQTYSQVSTSKQPCVDDSTYSKSQCMEKCFHNAIARKIGCTVPWLRHLDEEYPQCSNSTSIDSLYEAFNDPTIFFFRKFTESCNCLMPCNNSIYQYQIENRRDGDTISGPSSQINIYFQSNLVTELTDVVSYDWNTFLADVGGSLGFLLGLSVIGVVTVLEEFIRIVFRIKRGEAEEEKKIEDDNKLPTLEQSNGESLKSVMEFMANCDMYEHLQKENENDTKY
ncbi:hypothetical protein MTP99_007278 [Tenebrio molitor]|nr:hypothetical protein MTP99_007278 [Tenebrio molitor]